MTLLPRHWIRAKSAGNRTRRTAVRTLLSTVQQTLTAIVFAGGLSLAEYETANGSPSTANSPTVEYTRGPDMGGGVGGLLYSSRSDGILPSPTTLKYALSNGRGDIVAQADQNAVLTWTASYEAYGKRTRETGSNADKQRANSKDEDPTGLLNEGFRYRDLETGVWLSRDPAGFVDGPNLYAYVRQNPWTSFDPTGLFEVSPHQPIHELITVKAYANAIGASDQNALNAAKAGNPSVKTAVGSLAAGVKSPDLGKVTGRSVASVLLGPLGPVVERADQLHSLHYGDQQWKHSMSSTEKTAGELRDKIVKGLTDQFSSARKQFEAGNEAAAWATMGEVLHTVQDSYSASHTTRDPKTGEIMGYNSYPAQDGKKHATADSVSGGSFKSGLRGINIDDYSGVESKTGVREATGASTNIISAFMKGDASAFGKQLNETYRTSPKAEVGKSGGYGKDDP